MRRYIFILALAFAFCAAEGQGLRFISESDYVAMEKASIEMLEDLPSSHDLAKWFPPPGDQGDQGSCVGWAVAYGVKTYQEAIELQRKPTRPEHMFSPSFIYNQINDWGCMGGSSIREALNLMKNSGVATLESFPYDESDCQALPSGEIKGDAKNYTIDSWKTVEFRSEGIMKTLLFEGQPIVIGIVTDTWFNKLSEGEVHRVSSNRTTGGHALVVIGYDDRRGAYKVLNSWGDDWGDNGYGWIAYDIFTSMVREAYILVDSETPSQKTPPKKKDQSRAPKPSKEAVMRMED
ncbi:C1 family peptidase [Phaeocystidibacter luteus]|uniref:C1 family peptidase n=1 Tax=Phaeocystidibacter luteus TaxID=911197 RepID=A0A6N6REF3_9FLAO|nr:C1 family peptidase [Phaeocystidibacter luteus]KAB2806827.1 C1 family peptidase [Phaeocystidibacter luteus]